MKTTIKIIAVNNKAVLGWTVNDRILLYRFDLPYPGVSQLCLNVRKVLLQLPDRSLKPRHCLYFGIQVISGIAVRIHPPKAYALNQKECGNDHRGIREMIPDHKYCPEQDRKNSCGPKHEGAHLLMGRSFQAVPGIDIHYKRFDQQKSRDDNAAYTSILVMEIIYPHNIEQYSENCIG